MTETGGKPGRDEAVFKLIENNGGPGIAAELRARASTASVEPAPVAITDKQKGILATLRGHGAPRTADELEKRYRKGQPVGSTNSSNGPDKKR